jgi:glycerol-3-phosphate dehydrogenase (NAD(P)+)
MAASIAVLGDGGWGTTLALHLHHQQHRVTLWSAFPQQAAQLIRLRENRRFLPGIRLPRSLTITADLRAAVSHASLIILAVPSQHLRSVVRQLSGLLHPRQPILSVAKGIEQGSLKRMSQVIKDELGPVALAVLSGPNIAAEIASGHPASSVIASPSKPLAARLQQLFTGPRLRIYVATDVTGVELGGALKNPIAIAAGISDGLGFGANAKAALVTRGVVEMARLGKALGARPTTFWGLSGLGDLVTTCLAGRNHWLGVQLGQGRSLQQVLSSTPMVIEGVDTSQAAASLARRHSVELPIIEQVHAVLFKHRAPRQALKALMTRASRSEAI